ncbi:MAG: enoyl-CoA hydratase/isomerase family protein [Ilumatobacteraceae bacterium]
MAVVELVGSDDRNTLTAQDMTELSAAFRELQADESVRSVVLTGRGDVFCGGRDVGELGSLDIDVLTTTFWATPNRGLQRTITDGLPFSKPIVAAINGYCNGEGMAQALGADIRLASHTATFRLIEVEIGVSTVTAAALLTLLVGHGNASMLALTGDPIDAEEAHRIGLVSSLHEPGELIDAAMRVASRIAANAPLAVRAVKEVMLSTRSMSFESSVLLGESLRQSLRQSHDYHEGLSAFVEGRAPHFTGT